MTEVPSYGIRVVFVFVSDGKRVVFVNQQDDEDWLWEDEEMCEEDYEYQVESIAASLFVWNWMS